MTPAEFEWAEEQIRNRIHAIDKMFETTTGWGSWMATLSAERAGLCRQYRALGFTIEDKWQLTVGAPNG